MVIEVNESKIMFNLFTDCVLPLLQTIFRDITQSISTNKDPALIRPRTIISIQSLFHNVVVGIQ